MLNGNGIRVSLWVSGCEHCCNQCQNPQTWDVDSGIQFDKESENELFEALSEEYVSGLTLTGGDPLHANNLVDVLNLVNKIRLLLPKKTIWIYSGYEWDEIETNHIRREIVSKCDVLVDGRYDESQKDITLVWRGSSNQRVIDIQQTIKNNKIMLYAQ